MGPYVQPKHHGAVYPDVRVRVRFSLGKMIGIAYVYTVAMHKLSIECETIPCRLQATQAPKCKLKALTCKPRKADKTDAYL